MTSLTSLSPKSLISIGVWFENLLFNSILDSVLLTQHPIHSNSHLEAPVISTKLLQQHTNDCSTFFTNLQLTGKQGMDWMFGQPCRVVDSYESKHTVTYSTQGKRAHLSSFTPGLLHTTKPQSAFIYSLSLQHWTCPVI